MNRHLIAAAISQQDANKAAISSRYWYAHDDYELTIERQLIAAEWYARSRKWYEQGIESEDT
jgi:general stress protein 26